MVVVKVAQFILLAYAISWSVAGAMDLAGIEYGSFASIAIIALFYMPAPAYATLIVTKLLRRERLADYGVVLPKGRWRFFIITSVGLPLLLVAITFALIALLPFDGFGTIDFSEASVLRQIERVAPKSEPVPSSIPIPPALIFVLGVVQGIIAGGTVNALFAFGEELGWRGLMQRELERLGFWKSNVVIGTVWGLWHAPIILQGHNYGAERGAAGIVVMTLFTIALSFPFAYARLKTGTVFAPSIIHGIMNALGGLTVLFVSGADPFLGHIAGAAGIIAALIITIAIVLIDRDSIRGAT